MLKKLTILFFFIISANVIAQNVTWEKFIPGRLYKDEWANDICQTTDGNFVVVGTAIDSPYSIVEAVKINGYGDTLWLKRFHPPNSTASFGTSCCSAENGGSVITGSTGGLNTAFLTKLDINGNIIWEHEYSSYGITYHSQQVNKTSDGGYIVNGLDFIMKTDSLGNYKWHRHRLDYGYSNFIRLTIGPTGEYLILYEIINPPLYERGVSKFDENGNLKWQKAITNWEGQSAEVIKKLSNGYLLMGFFGDPSNIITFKMNEEGDFNSFKIISLERNELFDGAANIINDNKYVFVTGTQPQADTQYCIFRLIDSSGNILKTNQIKSAADSSFYFKYKFIHSALPLIDGYIMFAGVGRIQFTGQLEDFYIVRADSNLYFKTVGVINNGSLLPEVYNLYQNYPNPFNPITKVKFDLPKNKNVKLIIYDVLGREIITLVNEKLHAGSYTSYWDATNYSSGVYFYRLSADGNVINTKKMLLIK